MDIKQELDKLAGFIPVGESVREVARAALAEIEDLEKRCLTLARERNEAIGERDALTDRMIAAGLMT
jgi:hypothetical protein